MEDVLQTGYQDISHLSDADDLETARSEKKEGSLAPSRGASRLDMQTPTGSISSKAGKGGGGGGPQGGAEMKKFSIKLKKFFFFFKGVFCFF